jgi:hypothetical protein
MSIDNSKELKYDYYENLATRSNKDDGLHYSYKGKLNQPNITLFTKGDVKTFSANGLHIIPLEEGKGELLIENIPITNYEKNVFVHVPLSSDNSSAPNDIDKILRTVNSNVKLNKLLPNTTDCQYYEDNNGIHLNFQTPIKINSKLKPSTIEGFAVEGDIVVDGENMGADLSGLQISGEQWMDCDNVPYDTPEDEVKIYGLEVKTKFQKEMQNFMLAYYFVFFIIFLGLLYLLIDPFYKFIIFSLPGLADAVDPQDAIVGILKWYEIIFGAVLFIIGLGLILGGLAPNDNSNAANLDLKSSGTFIMIFLMAFYGVLFFKKAFSPLSLVPDRFRLTKDDEDDLKSYFMWVSDAQYE